MSADKPSLPLTGGCSCGAIRYEVASFPLLLYTCNCTDCQTASGSAFALNMPVAAKDFRIVKGEPKGWHHVSPSGAEVTSWFCAVCGGRLYGSRKSRPEFMNLRAGTLDDTGWLVPAGHMFVRSAQSVPNVTRWRRPSSRRWPQGGARCGRSSSRKSSCRSICEGIKRARAIPPSARGRPSSALAAPFCRLCPRRSSAIPRRTGSASVHAPSPCAPSRG